MMAWLETIHFIRPALLWLIPIGLLFTAVVIYFFHHHLASWATLYRGLQQSRYRHPLARLLFEMATPLGKGPLLRRLFSHWLAYAVLLSLLLLSLAQPYRLGEKLPDPPQYRDIVFLVDTSVNMSLRDYLVNQQRTDRMTIVKSVLQHFIKHLPGSRIGVVIFSEQSYFLVPLTIDHALASTQLQRLEPAVLTGRRSDPGKALLYTLDQLDLPSESDAVPVLVMLTDANRPVREIDPRRAAALVKQRGLRLHTIAMGAGSQAAREEAGTSLIYRPANFRLLEEIATAAGGEFFHADSQASLNRVLGRIQATEKHQVAFEPIYIKLPLYHWPLLLALLWVGLWQILPLLWGHLA